MRQLTLLDEAIISFDQGLRTLLATPDSENRPYPADDIAPTKLSPSEKKHVAGLMRVNHAGEVAAQALYAGQAILARTPDIRKSLRYAAFEEGDHLRWCQQRLQECNSHPSMIAPLWFAGSFLIGLIASLISDEVSLGFVIETEKQVIAHLQDHIAQLKTDDLRTKAVLEQMQQDEALHASQAQMNGGIELPPFIQTLMAYTAKVMTTTAYYV